MIGISIWGPFSSQYRSFEEAFISVLFFTLGQTDMFSLMKVYEVWSILYMTIFFLIMIYLIISTFIAIYADSYRLTILAEGYPDDSENQKDDWSISALKIKFKKFLIWTVGWLPSTLLKKLALKVNLEDQDEAEASNDQDDNIDSD